MQNDTTMLMMLVTSFHVSVSKLKCKNMHHSVVTTVKHSATLAVTVVHYTHSLTK